MNLKKVTAPAHKAINRRNNRKGVLTIVKKQGSSHCIIFSVQLAEELDLEDRVVVGFDKEDEKIFLAKKLPGITHDGYELKCRMSKGKCIKKVIYSASLVREIIETLHLDFSKKTSVTLYDLELDDEAGYKIAGIGR